MLSGRWHRIFPFSASLSHSRGSFDLIRHPLGIVGVRQPVPKHLAQRLVLSRSFGCSSIFADPQIHLQWPDSKIASWRTRLKTIPKQTSFSTFASQLPASYSGARALWISWHQQRMTTSLQGGPFARLQTSSAQEEAALGQVQSSAYFGTSSGLLRANILHVTRALPRAGWPSWSSRCTARGRPQRSCRENAPGRWGKPESPSEGLLLGEMRGGRFQMAGGLGILRGLAA